MLGRVFSGMKLKYKNFPNITDIFSCCVSTNVFCFPVRHYVNCAIKNYYVFGRVIVYLPVKENNQHKLRTSVSVTWVSCWLTVFIHPNVLSGRLCIAKQEGRKKNISLQRHYCRVKCSQNWGAVR